MRASRQVFNIKVECKMHVFLVCTLLACFSKFPCPYRYFCLLTLA